MIPPPDLMRDEPTRVNEHNLDFFELVEQATEDQARSAIVVSNGLPTKFTRPKSSKGGRASTWPSHRTSWVIDQAILSISATLKHIDPGLEINERGLNNKPRPLTVKRSSPCRRRDERSLHQRPLRCAHR